MSTAFGPGLRMSATILEKSSQDLVAHVMLAAWNMDMLSRLSLLEGAAAVAPGAWLRRRERGFAEALEFFGPTLDPHWTTTHDTGVYNTALRTATAALAGASGMEAADLIQTMISESSSRSGKPKHRLFYEVGSALRKHGANFQDGGVRPGDSMVKGTITTWVKNAARDVYKTWQQKHVTHGDIPVGHAPMPQTLDHDQKEKLLLMALQTPGQVGRKVRDIIEHEARRHWPRAYEVVLLFLEKISHPQYRSVSEMKRLIGKRWDVNRWFAQAFNKVRKEVMAETGMKPQALTNLLGSQGSKVFKFMRDHVGRNPKIQHIIHELAEEIELLEPGHIHMGNNKDREADLPMRQKPKQSWHAMQDWLQSLMTPPVTPVEGPPPQHPNSMAIPMDVETGEVPGEAMAMDSAPMDIPMDVETGEVPGEAMATHMTPMEIPMDVETGEVPGEAMAMGPSDLPMTAPMDAPMDVETGELTITDVGPTPLPMDLQTGEIDEKGAHLPEEQTPVVPTHSVRDWLEKDEHQDWQTQVSPHTTHSRGPAVLRVATSWIQRKADDQWKALKEEDAFKVWSQNRTFPHVETGNMDLYSSLPVSQQKQIRQWWQSNKCTDCQGKGKQQMFSTEDACPSCSGQGTGSSALGESSGKMMEVLKDIMADPSLGMGSGLPGGAHKNWQEVREKHKSNNPLHVMRAVRKFMYDVSHEEKHNPAGNYSKLYRTMKDSFKEYQSGLDKSRGDRVRDPSGMKKGERYIIKDPRSGSSTTKFRDITIQHVDELDGAKTFHYQDATGAEGKFTKQDVQDKSLSVSRPKTAKQASIVRLGDYWLRKQMAGVR